MKKKAIAALLAGTMAMGIFAGCGNADEGNSTPDNTPAEENTKQDDAQQEETNMRIKMQMTHPAQKAMPSLQNRQRLRLSSRMEMKARKSP